MSRSDDRRWSLRRARWLYEQAPTSQASKGIGYKELSPYFEGEMSLEGGRGQAQAEYPSFHQAPADLVS